MRLPPRSIRLIFALPILPHGIASLSAEGDGVAAFASARAAAATLSAPMLATPAALAAVSD